MTAKLVRNRIMIYGPKSDGTMGQWGMRDLVLVNPTYVLWRIAQNN
jgi:hypothetical protein